MSSELNAARWLASDSADPELLVVGVPNSKSTHASSADLAPLDVRHRLAHFPSGSLQLPVLDVGNLPVSTLDPTTLLEDLASRASALPSCFRVYLGGDNGITRPLVRAEADSLAKVGLIRFDTGRGTGDLTTGPSAANVVSGLVEDGMPAGNIVEIGIHALGGDSAASDEEPITGISVPKIDEIGMAAAVDVALSQLDGCSRIYVNVDLGVLDQSAAPGAPDARPGGLTTRELGSGLAKCVRHGSVTAVDLVGVDPTHDRGSLTLDAMAYLLLVAAAGRADLSPR